MDGHVAPVALVVLGGLCLVACSDTRMPREPVSRGAAQGAAPASVRAAIGDGDRVRVLAIGISRYKDPTFTPTDYANADAKAFADLFAPSVASEHRAVLTDVRATRRAMLGGIQSVLATTPKNGTAYLFFAGHGDQVQTGGQSTAGLVCYDSEGGRPETYYAVTNLLADLRRSVRAERLLLILDCCRSGAGGLIRSSNVAPQAVRNVDARAIAPRLRANGTSWGLLTACRPEQDSRASAALGHGYFTYWLLRGLEGHADSRDAGWGGDGNGLVTYRELRNFLEVQVVRSTNGLQQPVSSGPFPIETVLARSPRDLPLLDAPDPDAAVLTIDVVPTKATVTCDGRRIACVGGRGKVTLAPGRHLITAAALGHLSQEGGVELAPGEVMRLVLKLDRVRTPGGPLPERTGGGTEPVVF